MSLQIDNALKILGSIDRSNVKNTVFQKKKSQQEDGQRKDRVT